MIQRLRLVGGIVVLGEVKSSLLKNYNASQVGCAKCLVKRYGLYIG
jgi:hypothetical protein